MGLWALVMSGWKDKIPHIIPIFRDGEKSELLVTIASRQPLCLRCRREEHFHQECVRPYCQHCTQYGHLMESCMAAGTYASALWEHKTIENTAESENITEME